MRVGAGEEESLVSVRPAHGVGRFAVGPTHLNDFTLAPRGLGGSAFDDYVVAYLCPHGATLTGSTAPCKGRGDPCWTAVAEDPRVTAGRSSAVRFSGLRRWSQAERRAMHALGDRSRWS